MFAVAADIGTAVIIYKLIADKQGKVAATLLAEHVDTLLPVTLALSAAWGSMVSIAVFFAVLSFYFLLNKNYIGMACAYFVAAPFTRPLCSCLPPSCCSTQASHLQGIQGRSFGAG